ncbi:MAG: hypothetical protein LBB45_06210 [Methanobrevibacter sp.]|jgi:hypothetical protein|nr:hypothetical protein [Candidatus Methanovirga basalitermitum]
MKSNKEGILPTLKTGTDEKISERKQLIKILNILNLFDLVFISLKISIVTFSLTIYYLKISFIFFIVLNFYYIYNNYGIASCYLKYWHINIVNYGKNGNLDCLTSL